MKILRGAVPRGAPPDRLDRFLARVFPELSRSKAQRLIFQGAVRIGGRPVRKPSTIIRPGQEVAVQLPEAEPHGLCPEPIPLNIVHEDDFLLVVDKPAGMVVHPGAGHSRGTLVHALLAHAPRLSLQPGALRPGLVHRLDKDTSGLMVVAKDDRTHEDLSRQFADRKVLRIYLAGVRGCVPQDEGVIAAPIGRHPIHRQRMAVRYGSGRESLTRYRVLKRFAQATLLELRPQTGRMHQLRVHLAHLGHPILGDAQYGVRAGFPRQALHAHRLGFLHPGIQQRVEFVSPLPPDLQGLLSKLDQA